MSFTQHTVTYGPSSSKQITYLTTGPLPGPLLIFVHGWPATSQTWHAQLSTFAALGFRCVAPDLPGYGLSSSSKTGIEDYAQEAVVEGLLALLDDTGRDQAVWIGHDWGSACVWSLAAHHPLKCIAVASITVPYRTIDCGIEEAKKYINRATYPEDQYPDGQWSYVRYYLESFDKAVQFHDDNVEGFTKLIYTRSSTHKSGQPAFTATCVQDGGWLGGAPRAPSASDIPDSQCLLPPAILAKVTASLKQNGYFAPDAYYANDMANRAYNLESDAVSPYLDFPVLFIEARFDDICETVTSRLTEAQRRYCRNLTEVSIDAGHWVQLERPEETSAAIARWLATEVGGSWPGVWRTTSRKQ